MYGVEIYTGSLATLMDDIRLARNISPRLGVRVGITNSVDHIMGALGIIVGLHALCIVIILVTLKVCFPAVVEWSSIVVGTAKECYRSTADLLVDGNNFNMASCQAREDPNTWTRLYAILPMAK